MTTRGVGSLHIAPCRRERSGDRWHSHATPGPPDELAARLLAPPVLTALVRPRDLHSD